MLIFLLGYMGSGKTTAGVKLAGLLRYRFLDLDDMIELSTGYSIPVFFDKFGESFFRQKEREILMIHLQDRDTVIAAGGGTPCYQDNIHLMNKHGVTVFLDTPYEVIMQRLSGSFSRRPMLNKIPHGNMAGFIREHLDTRRVFYEQAKIHLISNKVDFDFLVKEISKFQVEGFRFQEEGE